ncbi:MAG: tRNA-uridine aminocarboxypropyltransferase [Pontibacterium sp.]
MSLITCSGCGLPDTYCACNTACCGPLSCQVVLLLHENEPLRPSNTSRLIQQLLPETLAFIWQRKEAPQALVDMIQSEDYQPWLLFPADRPDLQTRARDYRPQAGKTPLIIVPDGTWKEVRKIVRKSPWLASVPLLAIEPKAPSRYTLRRNPDADHLCTAETVAEVFRDLNEPVAAEKLAQQLDRFLHRYQAWKANHPVHLSD